MKTGPTIALWSIRLWLATFALYLTHRGLTFSLLGGSSLSSGAALEAALVGAMSDMWIAGVAATIYALVAIGLRRWYRQIFYIWYGILALATVTHQSYVNFFRHQILPVHLQYLYDWSFISANAESVTETRTLISAIVAGLSGWFVVQNIRINSLYGARSAWTAILLLSLLAHNRNIHFRVQWFVPDQLQMQGWEMLYFQLKNSRVATPLSLDELQRLNPSAQDLEQTILLPGPHADELRSPGREIARDFIRMQRSGEHPIAIVYLMESQRPSETGLYLGTDKSLTPHFDRLASAGVFFRRAYAVSNVTRGAQEAVFCGYRGSSSLSAMRGRSDLKIRCLPQSVSAKTRVMWLHAGDPRFDNQVDFWQNQGIPENNILDAGDFPEEAAKTGWGYSDHALVDASVKRLLQPAPNADQTLAMILTVTNHIPWTLPGDIDVSPVSNEHPSYATTRYADEALGAFVEQLKESRLWGRTLLIIVSDHGNAVRPLGSLYGKDTGEHLQSHILLALSGGLVDHNASAISIDDLTGQASIAAFLGAVLQSEGRYMDVSLFDSRPSLPVFTDLGRNLFLPGSGKVVRPEDLQASVPDQDHAILYFRGLLTLIDQWSQSN